MTDFFYNPYHFVPLADPLWTENAEDFREESKGPAVRHDVYAAGRLSGRLICRLVPETPLAVGAKQEKNGNDDNDYTLVEPYRIGGVPALPASSLKGMISSLLEQASGSALRVFSDRKPVSFRQPPEKALSALGQVVEEDGKLLIQPLAGPTIDRHKLQNFKKWHELFKGSIPLVLRFGEYPPDRQADIRGKRDFKSEAFSKSFSSRSAERIASEPSREPVYYASVQAKTAFDERGRPCQGDRTILHNPGGKDRFVIGQHAQGADSTTRIPLEEELSDRERQSLVRGFVRVLGGEDRDMADTKKHELFIPYPDENDLPAPLPISDTALERFKALAEEAAASVKHDVKRLSDPEKPACDLRRASRVARPYLPFGSKAGMARDRQKPADDGTWVARLRPGQIVYFDIEQNPPGNENGFQVSHLAFSSIWRDLVHGKDEVVGRHDFVDKEQRPYNIRRDKLTPAELIFGFVEEAVEEGGEKQEPSSTRHRAYRGRLRFSAGVINRSPDDVDDLFLHGDLEVKRENQPNAWFVRLRELSSPKPPSPHVYFRPGNGKVNAKHKLSTSDSILGRKSYLHHPKARAGETTWETGKSIADDRAADSAKRKLAVRPLKPGKIKHAGGFWFHIDFDNMSEDELDLLCFALRPSDGFRHKLGLGKPLGLGTVGIEPMFLGLIDRRDRYVRDDPFTSPRFSATWRASLENASPPPPYAADMETAGHAVDIPPPERDPKARAEAFCEFLSGKLPDVHQALLALGDPEALSTTVPVHYPKSGEQADTESENYTWFANNTKWIDRARNPKNEISDEDQPQRLKSIAEAGGIEPLRVNREPPKGGGPRHHDPRPHRQR